MISVETSVLSNWRNTLSGRNACRDKLQGIALWELQATLCLPVVGLFIFMPMGIKLNKPTTATADVNCS